MAKEQYEAMKKHKKQLEAARRMIDTTEAEHSTAYLAALDSIRDEKGHVDYKKLEETKNQMKFADIMSKHYIKEAKKALKSDISEKDEFESELLMKAYAGVTRAELRRAVASDKKKFTLKSFEANYKPAFMQSITNVLYNAADSHLTEKHIEDIVKYMKLEKHLDTKYLTRDSAVKFLYTYHSNDDEMSRKDIEAIIADSKGMIPEKALKKKKKGKVIPMPTGRSEAA